MQRLINGRKVDLQNCTKILEVDAHIGRRTLLKTKAGNFLTLEQCLSLLPPEIVPMTRQEALDFLQIHQEAMSQKEYWKVLKTHFNINPETHDKEAKLPYGARPLAKAGGLEPETLFISDPGGLFYLKSNSDFKELSKTEALQWIEHNQNEIKNLDQILSNHFPTISNY